MDHNYYHRDTGKISSTNILEWSSASLLRWFESIWCKTVFIKLQNQKRKGNTFLKIEISFITVSFENFLARKYVGKKRFSLEGAESLIPSLHCGIQEGANLGVSEFVFGMAHRGRLNILANIFYADMYICYCKTCYSRSCKISSSIFRR